MLTNDQFERVRRFALGCVGIELFERHREVLDRKCHRLGLSDKPGFDTLLDAAESGDQEASQRLVGLVTTNFTGFFRHPWHFDLAAEHALWAVHRRGAARLWSAAAATGEEPWSLAIALCEVFHDGPPAVIVHATDVDEEALTAARRGEYGESALGALERRRRAAFFHETGEPGRWRINQAARDLVKFERLSLSDVVWPLAGPLDVVFCRNVLMYLDAGNRYSVLERIASLLASDGLLMLDPAEHLGRAGHLFNPGTQGVYRLAPIPRSSRGNEALTRSPDPEPRNSAEAKFRDSSREFRCHTPLP